MLLTILAERRNSPSSGRPSTSSRMVCMRSPCATARIVRVTSAVGHNKSSIKELIDNSMPCQAPAAEPILTRCLVLPSCPTTCPTRSSCCAICSLEPTISLNRSATLPQRSGQSPGSRTEKFPPRMCCRACNNCRTSALVDKLVLAMSDAIASLVDADVKLSSILPPPQSAQRRRQRTREKTKK